MRKLIMFIFMVLSLATIILISMSLNQVASLLGISLSWDDIMTIIQNVGTEGLTVMLGTVLIGIFQLYGIPLIVFLVSLNGLAIKRK